MKTSLITFMLLLAPVAFGQRPVEPIHVSIDSKGSRGADGAELARRVRAELQPDGERKELKKPRDIAFTPGAADFEIHLNVMPLAPSDLCRGYACAVMVKYRARGELHAPMWVETGPTLGALAESLGAYINREFFEARRRSPR